MKVSESPIDIDAQPRDVRGLSPETRDALIVTFARVSHGWVIQSRYSDDRWVFQTTTTNAVAYDRVLRFDRVPAPFRDVVKALIYRYMRRGRSLGTRPSVGTMRVFMERIGRFLNFLEQLNLGRLGEASQTVCKMYVDAVKAEKSVRGKLRNSNDLEGLFRAVEALHELSQYTEDPMLRHPWPGTSAARLAGSNSTNISFRGGKTPLMPDAVYVGLFQASWVLIEEADHLLALRDAITQVEVERQGLSRTALFAAKNLCLEKLGWTRGIAGLRSSVFDLRTACYIVVASLSGCRNHELAFTQTGACYSTEDDEGAVYWWMRSTSTKTGEGMTEWMIPQAAVRAMEIMDRWAKPYQLQIAAEIEFRRQRNPNDTGIAEAERHLRAVFVGLDLKTDQVRTLSSVAWRDLLKKFAKDKGIIWNLTTHQFRRTFANYAARSRFGDLRYLKEHFKHWSMDMTLGYALNDSQEIALYREIYEEFDDIKEALVDTWFHPNEPLSGGYGDRLARWRGTEGITLFKDRSSMVRAIADTTAIRANGHAWCTADDGQCVGSRGVEWARCSDCGNAVIGSQHASVYQQMYDQLAKLSTCEDIGVGGLARVERDLARCRHVLVSLGYEPKGVG